MKKYLSYAAIFLLSACGTANKPVADTTPEKKTVVLTAKGVINGNILPNYHFNQHVYTRVDMRTISTNGEYDSWMARQFFGEVNDTVIFRIDKNLRWLLTQHKDKKTYTECPLAGCNFNILAQLAPKQDNSDEQVNYNPDQPGECKMTLVKNSFKVTVTGQTREIAGYRTKEYKAVWLMEYKDDKGKIDRNTLTLVFWNTDPTATMNEAWKIDGEATKNYLAKIKQSHNPLAEYLPDNIFMALSAFSGDTSKESQTWKTTVARELAKAKGYPMSIKTEWYLDRNACVEVKPQKKSADWSNPLQALKDTANDFAGKQAEKMFMPDPKQPIFRYIYDVTSVDIKPVHDSAFDVPAGYKLVTRE